MIKIAIQSLEGNCDIEIKKNDDQYWLLIIMSKSDYLKETGSVWHEKIKAEGKILEITNLIKQCHKNPSVAKMETISDGMKVDFNLKEEGVLTRLTIKNIEKGMNEFLLMQNLFELINALIKDPILKKYIEVFEKYLAE